MNYHDITKADMKNGDGLRVVLWVSGCSHHCKGCQNPQTWDPESGIPFDDAAKAELFEELSKDYISGITFSGGDPLSYYNRDTVVSLMSEIKRTYPDKTIWCYTGYDIEDLDDATLDYIDVLVDGLYVEALRDVTAPWVGSTNQRIWRR